MRLVSGLGREGIAEHGETADRLGTRGLVLENVPVFLQKAILKANDIGSNPGAVATMAAKTSKGNYIVTVSYDQLILVAQSWRE
jgi:hypothetical protein